MPSENSSLFERVIQEHVELKARNARLDSVMPIERYKRDDPFKNNPLFKTEEQARIEESMDGLAAGASDTARTYPGEDELTREDAAGAGAAGLWTGDPVPDFDWGD